MTCSCGLPMSRNPHPDAGKPNDAGVAAGYVWECIPCLVATRNRVGASWREAQSVVERMRHALERIAKEPAPGYTLSCRNIARAALADTAQAATIAPNESDTLVPKPTHGEES